MLNIVLIAPLQSPWSSVTQGPFISQVLTLCSQFKSLTASLVQHMVKPCKKREADSEVKSSDINEIILVGSDTYAKGGRNHQN